MTKPDDSTFPESVAIGPAGDVFNSSQQGLTKLEYFSALFLKEMVRVNPNNDDELKQSAKTAKDYAKALIEVLNEE